jgi:hypothetical protein
MKESRKSLTKIVATIGPASEQFEPLQAVRPRRAFPCCLLCFFLMLVCAHRGQVPPCLREIHDTTRQ